jgi:ABC-type glycerol-3-phosphate transport system substrate-binding protein
VTRIDRRAFVAAGLGIAGAAVGLKARESPTIRGNIARTRSIAQRRDPLLVAMLDRHATRMSTLVPEIEARLDRRLSIESLPATELYANYTIDLLQQTGRYDVVSMSDAWLPYFGRRGYLTAVPDLDDEESSPTFPTQILQAATGIDGTERVAYPWTTDFACLASRAEIASGVTGDNWVDWFRRLDALGSPRVGMALRPPASAAETFRAVLLSYGGDLVESEAHTPALDRYPARRAMESVVRLIGFDDPEMATTRSLQQLPELAAEGPFDLLPVIWASDARPLWESGQWALRLIPDGMMGKAVSSVAFWMWAVPAGAPNVEAARSFVELLTGPDMQGRLWPEAGLLPATRAALNSEWTPGGEAARRLALDAVDHARFQPRIRSFRALMDICGRALVDTIQAGDSNDERRLAANEQMRAVLTQEGELDG